MHNRRAKITGVVLAGGRARRMGGQDKGLVLCRGRPLIAYALDALRGCTDRILINANRNREIYEGFGYTVIADESDGFEGPLAGVLSALKAAQTPLVLTVPCDCPLIRSDFFHRLWNTMQTQDAEICTAFDGERLHPVFLLMERRLLESLADYLASGRRKIDLWLNQRRSALADFSDRAEMFLNVNTPAQLSALEGRLSSREGVQR